MAWLNWVYPRRRLTPELDKILAAGTLKGADLWHLACALFLRPQFEEMAFLTLDGNQADVARALGFRGF